MTQPPETIVHARLLGRVLPDMIVEFEGELLSLDALVRKYRPGLTYDTIALVDGVVAELLGVPAATVGDIVNGLFITND